MLVFKDCYACTSYSYSSVLLPGIEFDNEVIDDVRFLWDEFVGQASSAMKFYFIGLLGFYN